MDVDGGAALRSLEREGVVEVVSECRVDREREQVAQVGPVGVLSRREFRGFRGFGQDLGRESALHQIVGEEGVHDVAQPAALAERAQDLGPEAVGKAEQDDVAGLRLDVGPLHRESRAGLEERLYLQALAVPHHQAGDAGRAPGSVTRRDESCPQESGAAAFGAAASFAAVRQRGLAFRHLTSDSPCGGRTRAAASVRGPINRGRHHTGRRRSRYQLHAHPFGLVDARAGDQPAPLRKLHEHLFLFPCQDP